MGGQTDGRESGREEKVRMGGKEGRGRRAES
jgi:hypothetical protein